MHNRNIDEELWYVNGAAAIAVTGTVTVRTALAAAIAVTIVEMSGIASTAPLDVSDTTIGVSAHPVIGPTAATVASGEIAIGGHRLGRFGGPEHADRWLHPAPLEAVHCLWGAHRRGDGHCPARATGTQTYGAALSGAASWTGILATFKAQSAPPTPSPTQTVTPSPSPTPTGSPIKHVVVIYQENHAVRRDPR